MESGTLRKQIPPDWGADPSGGNEVGHGIWELGEAGPSDFVRRAWVAGKTRSGLEKGKWIEDDNCGESGWIEGFMSAMRPRPRSTHARRHSLQSSSSSGEGDDPGEMEDEVRGIESSPDPKPTPPYRRFKSNRSSSLLPLALLPLLPIARAAPPIYTRPARAQSPAIPIIPKPTTSSQHPSHRNPPIPRNKREVSYQTSAAPPAVYPTELATVDETLLPYIVSKGPDGYWTKVNDGWRLYGRQSGESPVFAPNQPDSTQTSTWAIDEALPPGWGVQSSRTDFYRVPLIVVSACLIAVGLVVAIVVITLKRKKAQRRAKRRAERKRRKELAAAGLTEERVNDTSTQANLREKLEDLQRQHRAKRKGETAVVSGSSARNRVRSWRAGLLRRRKGKGDGDDEGLGSGTVVDVEPKTENGDVAGQDRDSQETDRSTPTVPSDEPSSGSDAGIGSRLNTLSSEETDSTTQIGTTDTSTSSNPPDLAVPTSSTATPYFPPAYRPASVRSFGPRDSAAGPSLPPAPSPANASNASPALPSAEKVHVPGYYPAPATAEGEAALAVASRSEGKGRIPIPYPSPEEERGEDREHTGHAATDDKLVMERMRMAASAPPAPPPEDEGDGSGPSAPAVEVDRDGFERLVYDQPELGPSSSPPPITLAPPITQQHPSLPAPPIRPHFNRSYSIEREVHEQLDELNLLPSAPPIGTRAAQLRPSSTPTTPAPSAPSLSEDIVPSAPPMLEDGDDEDVEEQAPSAPPLAMEEDVEEAMVEGETVSRISVAEESGRSGEAAGAEDEAPRRPSEAPSEPRVFLPKYEP